MASASSPPSVNALVPNAYRVLLTTIEPIMTIAGVLATIGDPSTYVQTVGGPSAPLLPPQLYFLYTQLCGSWLFMAFNGAVLLRMVDDVRVWYLICGGMLLSDVVFAHSCAQAMGGWDRFVQVQNWHAMDWVVFLTSAPLGVVRAMFLARVGFKAPRKGAKRA